MSNGLKVIIAILAAAIIAIGAVWFMSGDNEDTTPAESGGQTSSQQNARAEDDAEQAPAEEAEVSISYTDNGFVPAQITVPAGSTIEVVNESRVTMEFASDQHPTHTDNTELNAGIVSPGSSTTFVVNEPGTWGYHNHLNEEHGGEIVVE